MLTSRPPTYIRLFLSDDGESTQSLSLIVVVSLELGESLPFICTYIQRPLLIQDKRKSKPS